MLRGRSHRCHPGATGAQRSSWPTTPTVTPCRAQIDSAIAHGDQVLWLTDRRGRQIAVPVAKLAYVEVGPPDGDRRIGFGS